MIGAGIMNAIIIIYIKKRLYFKVHLGKILFKETSFFKFFI